MNESMITTTRKCVLFNGQMKRSLFNDALQVTFVILKVNGQVHKSSNKIKEEHFAKRYQK